jgi:hypothetical protein
MVFSSIGALSAWAAPIVGIDSTPSLDYWIVASDSGVLIFGDARFHGSMAGQSLAWFDAS